MPRLTEEKKAAVEASIRECVYVCALEIMSEDGWTGFTMDKLATRIGVSKGTIYNYFQDKSEVIRFVVSRHDEFVAAEYSRIIACGMGATDTLRAMVGYAMGMVFSTHKSSPSLMKALITGMEEVMEGLYHDDPMKKSRDVIISVLERGNADGDFDIDPAMGEMVIHTMMCGVVRQLSMNRFQSPESFCDGITGIIFNGICGRMKAA